MGGSHSHTRYLFSLCSDRDGALGEMFAELKCCGMRAVAVNDINISSVQASVKCDSESKWDMGLFIQRSAVRVRCAWRHGPVRMDQIIRIL